MRMPKVGDAVVYHDSKGVPHNALVTAAWSDTCVNVVMVSGDESQTDTYGRQIGRETSCQHKSVHEVHGNYWRFADEEPIPYKPPVQT